MTSHDLIRELRQARLELQDDRVLEQFWFGDDDHVVATLGSKDGPVCGPVLQYRITDDAAVEITGSDGTKFYRWEQLQISGDVLTVMCAGVSKKFSITRTPQKERYLP